MIVKDKVVIKHRSVSNESKKMARSTRSEKTNNEGLKKHRAQLELPNKYNQKSIIENPATISLARLWMVSAIGINPPITNFCMRIIQNDQIISKNIFFQRNVCDFYRWNLFYIRYITIVRKYFFLHRNLLHSQFI